MQWFPSLWYLAEAAFAKHLVQDEVVQGELVKVVFSGGGVQRLRLLHHRGSHVPLRWGVPRYTLLLWRGVGEEVEKGR